MNRKYPRGGVGHFLGQWSVSISLHRIIKLPNTFLNINLKLASEHLERNTSLNPRLITDLCKFLTSFELFYSR